MSPQNRQLIAGFTGSGFAFVATQTVLADWPTLTKAMAAMLITAVGMIVVYQLLKLIPDSAKPDKPA